jgi:hypothetical protein
MRRRLNVGGVVVPMTPLPRRAHTDLRGIVAQVHQRRLHNLLIGSSKKSLKTSFNTFADGRSLSVY